MFSPFQCTAIRAVGEIMQLYDIDENYRHILKYHFSS